MRYIVSEPGAVATGSTGKFENKHNPVSITLAMARSHPPPQRARSEWDWEGESRDDDHEWASGLWAM